MKQKTDISFPRGSAKKRTKFSDKSTKDDLFKSTTNKSTDFKKKNTKNTKQNEDKAFEGVVVENPSFEIYGPGFKVLGCIKAVLDMKVIVQLPGNLNGIIPVTGISQIYTNLLKKSITDSNLTVSPLKDIFQVGQLLPCCVNNVGVDAETMKKSITLTTDPHKVNSDLNLPLLRHGFVISAAVADIEDHGYEMDIGIKGVKAFLKKEECKGHENNSFSIGQVIQCMVCIPNNKNPAARISGRIVNLSADFSKVKSSMIKHNMNVNIHSLVPGMLVQSSVITVLKEGLILKTLDYDSCASKLYLESYSKKPQDYAIDELVSCRLLYIHPVLKTIYVTLNSYLVSHNRINPKSIFQDYAIGSIIKNACVKSVSKNTINLETSDNVIATCKVKNLKDKNSKSTMSDFAVDTVHKCRVIDHDLLHSALVLSLKKSDLEMNIFTINDLKIGETYECVVKRIMRQGLAVKISPKLTGFVPEIHMADVTLSRPEKYFKVGQKLKCRLLSFENDGKMIKFTNKSLLVKSKNPIFNNFDDLKQGDISDGYIISLASNHLVLAFYNNITGFVSRHQMGIKKNENPLEIFQKGQVIKCQVLNKSDNPRKLSVSLKIQEKKVAKIYSDLDCGKIVTIKIKRNVQSGLDVLILPEEAPGFLPLKHLSDCLELCPLLHSCYTPGSEIEAIILNLKNSYIVSCKNSLLQAARDDNVVCSYDDLNEGMLINGFVSKILDYGMFITCFKNLFGLVPKKNIDVWDLEDNDNQRFEIGQSVIAKITGLDVEKNRMNFSLKLRDVYSGDVSSSIDYMSSYLTDLDTVLHHFKKQEGDKKNLSTLNIGQVVSVKVSKVMKSGFTGIVNSIVPCICTKEHYEDVELKEGDEINGVILYMNVNECSVQVSILPSIVKKCNDLMDNWHSRINLGQKLKCDVILACENYILVLLRGHASGRIAFIPNKTHLNDTVGRISLFTLFSVYPVCVKRIVNDKIIVALDAHDSRPKLVKKLADKRKLDNIENTSDSKRSRTESTCSDISLDEIGGSIKKHDLELGKVYDAVIKSIKTMQMNILVNGKVPGRVYISEVSDDIIEGQNPLDQFKVGQNLKVRIIKFREIKTKSYLPITHRNFTQALPDCSARSSVVHNEDYNCESADESICSGQNVVGYFKSFVNSCLWFRITPQLDGKIYVLNFADNPDVLNEAERLKPGAAYHATVVSSGLDQLQMTRTGVQQVKEGAVVIGKVLSTRSSLGSLLRLPLGYRGSLDLTDMNDNYELAFNMLEEMLTKPFIRCCLLEVNHQTKQCVLSTRCSRVKRNFKSSIRDCEFMDIGDICNGDVIRGFVKEINNRMIVVKLGRSIEGRVLKDNLSPNFPSPRLGSVVDVKILSVNEVKQLVDLQLLENEVIDVVQNNSSDRVLRKRKVSISDKEENIKPTDKSITTANIGESTGFVWESNLNTISQLAANDNSSDSDSDDDEENEAPKKRKRRTAKLEKEEEMDLHNKERLLLENNDNLPKDADSFDRAVLSSPDSSIIWLQYMAFHLEQAEIEKSRSVAERALKTISFREEQEKFNIWISLLNLENLYGTPESLKDVLNRALNHCDQLTVYNKLVGIYTSSNKIDDAEALYNVMLKKFHQNRQIWIDFGLFMLKNGQFEKSRNLMQRALKSLDKKDHLEILAKYAQNEISHGDVERGKTMFDNVLSTYPKRTDLWSVYIDQLINHGNLKSVRQVLDKTLKLNLPIKKMKFFYKKYITFEEKFGTPENVEAVKQRLIEYVESK